MEEAEALGMQEEVLDTPISGNSVPPHRRLHKRILDLSAVLVTSPLWLTGILIGAVWIKLVSRGSVFFRQERVGLAGEKFVIFKFRTMKEGAGTAVHEHHFEQLIQSNKPMQKLDGVDSRLIRGGRLMRATGLDELPQIFNVIIGNMSLVGPRPCTPSELEKYKRPFMRRFGGLPGITGSWQVNGKNETTFRRMIALDVLYLRNVSVRQDLWIMARTAPTLLKQIRELFKEKLRRQVANGGAASSKTRPAVRPSTPAPKLFPAGSRPARQSLLPARRFLGKSPQSMSDTQPLTDTPSGDTQRINFRPPGA